MIVIKLKLVSQLLSASPLINLSHADDSMSAVTTRYDDRYSISYVT